MPWWAWLLLILALTGGPAWAIMGLFMGLSRLSEMWDARTRRRMPRRAEGGREVGKNLRHTLLGLLFIGAPFIVLGVGLKIVTSLTSDRPTATDTTVATGGADGPVATVSRTSDDAPGEQEDPGASTRFLMAHAAALGAEDAGRSPMRCRLVTGAELSAEWGLDHNALLGVESRSDEALQECRPEWWVLELIAATRVPCWRVDANGERLFDLWYESTYRHDEEPTAPERLRVAGPRPYTDRCWVPLYPADGTASVRCWWLHTTNGSSGANDDAAPGSDPYFFGWGKSTLIDDVPPLLTLPEEPDLGVQQRMGFWLLGFWRECRPTPHLPADNTRWLPADGE